MKRQWQYVLASLAVHAAAICAAATMSRLSRRDMGAPVPGSIRFEVVEATTPEASGTPEKTQALPERPPIPSTQSLPSPQSPLPLQSPQSPKSPQSLPSPKPIQPPPSLPSPQSPQSLPPPPPLKIPSAPEERAAVDAIPRALNRIAPVYPRSARRKGHEGRATVEFSIGEDGGVTAARVAAASGHAELDAAALDAVRAARFEPVRGRGPAGPFRLTLDFKLR